MTICKPSLALAALLGVLAAGSASANSAYYNGSFQYLTLDFDRTFSGAAIGSYGAPYGPLVSDVYATPGITFTGDDYIYPGGTGGQSSGPNFASGLGDLAPFEIDFAKPQSFVSAVNITNSEYTLTAYDAANNVLGSVTTSTDFETTALASPNAISKVIFTATNTAGFGFGYGFDNLTVTNVPEPGGRALLAGFAMTGGSLLLRRRK